MKVSELIEKLKMIQLEHGVKVCKMYTQKWEDAEWMRNQFTDGDLEEKDENLYDVDLTKPIFKAVLL